MGDLVEGTERCCLGARAAWRLGRALACVSGNGERSIGDRHMSRGCATIGASRDGEGGGSRGLRAVRGQRTAVGRCEGRVLELGSGGGICGGFEWRGGRTGRGVGGVGDVGGAIVETKHRDARTLRRTWSIITIMSHSDP